MALVLLTMDAFESFVLIFIACELSQRISDAFNQFDEIIIQYKWYLFSNELKQILPMIMINTQKPFTMECFGSISCCRDVFKRVRQFKLVEFVVPTFLLLVY